MGIVFSWIILSFIVGAIGSGRKVGFGGAFFASLILSPVIGFIIAIISKSKDDEAYKKEILETQKSQKIALENISSNPNSLATEIKKLKELYDDGTIDDTEYLMLKEKLINK